MGACNGFIHAEAFGGTPPYTFNWNTLPPLQDQMNLCPGTYTCFVMDANSLNGYNQVTIMEPLPLLMSLSSTNDNGSGNGTALAITSGGTQPYTYLWSVNAASQTISTATGLTAGTYYATVTDAFGCTNVDFVEVLLSTGIIITKTDFDYTFFPNPVKSDFNLKICGGDFLTIIGKHMCNIWLCYGNLLKRMMD